MAEHKYIFHIIEDHIFKRSYQELLKEDIGGNLDNKGKYANNVWKAKKKCKSELNPPINRIIIYLA